LPLNAAVGDENEPHRTQEIGGGTAPKLDFLAFIHVVARLTGGGFADHNRTLVCDAATFVESSFTSAVAQFYIYNALVHAVAGGLVLDLLCAAFRAGPGKNGMWARGPPCGNYHPADWGDGGTAAGIRGLGTII